MSEPMMAEDDSPMMMTVGQYNAMVARTWGLAVEETIAAERERIIKILESNQCRTCPNHPGECDAFIHDVDFYIQLINGETK
jgi:hypothetical protein